jgi:hypothetical protein
MDEEDRTLEKLILEGAVEFSGIDSESGEILYNFTPKLQEIMPELYDEHMSSLQQDIMYFWQEGFLAMNDITSDNPMVALTDKCFNDDAVLSLPKDKQRGLEEIKRVLGMIE